MCAMAPERRFRLTLFVENISSFFFGMRERGRGGGAKLKGLYHADFTGVL